MIRPLVSALVAAALSALLTGWVRRHALQRDLLDHPNERSSHTAPTPRGGGLALAIVTLAGTLVLAAAGALAWPAAIGLVGGGALVAGIGWLDDLSPRHAALRAGVHAMAAAWLLYWIGGVGMLRLGAGPVPLGTFGNLLALGAIVWSINLYNFMDGIDGLAGGQAVLAAGTGAALLAAGAPGLASLSAVVAGAGLGFLWWNWAPARIFMGDVGSGLLGFLFAALAILSDQGGGPGILTWAMLGGVFVADATLTLLRRMLRRERWYAAHRSHAYQRAVVSGWSHARVTGAALALGGLGVLLAWAGHAWPGWFWPALVGDAVLLVGVYLLVERRAPMRRPGA